MGEDVELCLEVQVDPESKKILSNPKKCRSTLLDVTVVRPKEPDLLTTHRTNTLRADEVRKLISSLEKQRRKKQKVLDQLKYDDTIVKVCKHEEASNFRKSRNAFTKHKPRISPTSPVDDVERKDFIGIAESVEPLFCEIRRSLKNVETRITDMQDINLMLSETTVVDTGSEDLFFTRNRPSSPIPKRLRTHDVCRHELSRPKHLNSILHCQSRRKTVETGDRIEGKCFCENCGTVGFLLECQKHPLLTELSESPVPCHYQNPPCQKKRTRFAEPLKDVNHEESDYIDQLCNRIKMLEERVITQEEKVVPKDYFKKIITKMVTNFAPKIAKSKSETHITKNLKASDCKSIQVVIDQKKTIPNSQHHEFGQENFTKIDKSTLINDDNSYGNNIWRWGEEILKPGIDLKNRIVTLIHELLGRLALTENFPTDQNTKKDQCNSEHFRNFMKYVNTRMFNTHVDMANKIDGFPCEPIPLEDSVKVEHKVTTKVDNEKNINISYINPKLSLWQKESPCHHEILPPKKMTDVNCTGKQEFMRIVSKAKQHQKDVLWRNIWNQAKVNNQTKDDKITIKIPLPSKRNKSGNSMFETELTIREVERILRNA